MVEVLLERTLVRPLIVAWTIVMGSVVWLGIAYPDIPAEVVLYRLPWADAAIVGSRSLLSVGRIPLMGVGQLGAATAMLVATRESTAWSRFWRWLALTAALKTLLECVGLMQPQDSAAERTPAWLTFVLVGGFVAVSAYWWSRGRLVKHPRVAGRA